METLHGYGGAVHIVSHLALACQCLPDSGEQEGAPTLAFATHPVDTDAQCAVIVGLDELLQFGTGEPAVDLFANGLVVEQRGRDFLAEHGEQFLHIVLINMGVAATGIV